MQLSWLTLIEFIQDNKQLSKLTPEVVYAYAYLLLRDDDDLPITPARHHRLWMELVCDETIKKLLIIAPPGSAKTTWLVSAYLGAYIGFYPERSVIIGCVDDSTAEKRSLSLRSMTEDNDWRNIFPDVMPDNKMKWEQREWSIAPEGRHKKGRIHPTVRSYGVDSSISGSRADFMLGDDLLDVGNTRVKTRRKKFAEWFESSFLPRRKGKESRTVIIGTSWNADDYYAKIRRSPDGWVVCHVPLLSDEDKFYAGVTYGN